MAEVTHPVSRESSVSVAVTPCLYKQDESVRDFTALTTRMSTVMGNSDSLFRLFSSCRDKKGSVQTCHTEPQTAIRKEENAALSESLLERSKWQQLLSQAPEKLNTGTNCKEIIVFSPTRPHLRIPNCTYIFTPSSHCTAT